MRQHFTVDSRIRLAFLAITIVLLAVVGSQCLSLYRSFRQLNATAKDTAQWSLLQVQTEHFRLVAAAEDLDSENAATVAEFANRLDIYISRINSLRTGAEFVSIRKVPEIAASLLRLGETANRLTDLMAGGTLRTLAGCDAARALLDGQSPEVNRFIAKVIEEFTHNSETERRTHAQLLFSVAGMLGLLLILLATVVVILLSQMAQLKTREEALIESQAQIAATIRSSLDAVIVADAQGRILEWNGGAERCFGFTRDEAVGATMSSIIIPDRHKALLDAAMRLFGATDRTTKAVGRRIEIEALHADGREFPVELAVGVATGTRQPIFVAFVRDITDRRGHEAELQAAVTLAEAGNRSKANFLAVMSHEMRTPLNGVIGSLDLLARGELLSEQRHYVDVALQSGELLLAQINDVLDISKLDAGKLTLEEAPFDLRGMAQSVLDIVEPQAVRQGTQLSLAISDDAPQWVVGDPIRLRQVLLNLVSNAVKFTHDGAISVRVDLAGAADAAEMFEFAIKDTGIGIDPDRLGDLFEDFTMIDSSYSRRVGGTGLGLAISKRLVGAMSGRIGVSSQAGVGSRFWFRVPLKKAVRPVLDATASAVAWTVDVDIAPLKILLVEDNLTNQMVAQRMLMAEGHKVLTAGDGREALDAASSQRFDLILMDISMPEMDGLEAARRIKALPSLLASVPIIAMTAHAVTGDRERFLAAGMVDYVSKPIRLKQLLAAIGRVMSVNADRHDDASSISIEHQMTSDLPLLNASEIHTLADETSIEMLPLILAQFLAELESRGRDIGEANRSRNIPALRRAAHSLAGLGATLGATRLAVLMRAIESLCIEDRPADALDLSGTSGTVLDDTITAYRAFDVTFRGIGAGAECVDGALPHRREMASL